MIKVDTNIISNNSKTLSVLKHFYEVVESNNPTKDEKDSIKFYQFQLAQAIIEDFNNKDASTIAKLILDYID